MKIALAVLFGFLVVISSTGSSSAKLNIYSELSPQHLNEKSELYCGLALPPEGEQGGQGEETNPTDETDDDQQGQEESSGSETDSESQSEQEN